MDVLVVVQDALFARYVVACLSEARRLRASCGLAASLVEARRKLAGESFQCILLDPDLPDARGADAVRQVLEAAPGVPIIVLTSARDAGIADEALQSGVQEVIDRIAAEPAFLERAIRHAMDRGKWAAAQAAATLALEQRNRDLDDFVHAVSHDLKSPLRALYLSVGEARKRLLANQPAAADALLAEAEPRVRRLFHMIDGMLELSRQRAAANHLVDAAALARDVVQALDVPSHFPINVSMSLHPWQGDPTALRQVFQNLIDNAVKHHDRAEGTVEVTGRDLGGILEFRVSDDGPGIPEEAHERVFRAFHKLDDRHPDSTGVGLAIVRKLIEAQGGTIVIEPHLPRGATFRFTWPKQPSASVVQAAAAALRPLDLPGKEWTATVR
ncbi:MAG: sensor histidine kinase [Thermoplasmatota archaeon]